MRIAYLVSRFPHVSETFILRELNAVARQDKLEVTLCSLFPPVDGTVHEAARPWLAVLQRPRPLRALGDLLAWTLRRPWRMLSTVAIVTGHHLTSPRLLVRALATVLLAAAHARRLARAEVEHVHAHYATYPALAAWVIERLTGIPYSFTAHAHDIFVDRRMLRCKLERADFVATISEFNRRRLEQERGRARTPIYVVHCGIEVARYRFAPRRPAPDGPVRAVCVASLQEYKGHRVLLDALARGGAGCERLSVDLVGDGPLRAPLARQAAAGGLERRLRFHGSLPEDRVRVLLDAADLFVLPSVVASDGQMEGLPVALMEALADGLVVVTTRLSGIPELIVDGVTGFLAEPGDPESLRRALARALSGDAARLRPRQARALVEREYDAARNGRRLAELVIAARA